MYFLSSTLAELVRPEQGKYFLRAQDRFIPGQNLTKGHVFDLEGYLLSRF